ncbi:tetratricopeptide (TPR) repeat protein [Actinokineospora baliensis]|uniref:ATP-binding protein n=1 Tax=Actinokineospora baliensis TaxID=547056 RepID=UPI00195E3380|nr:tetratricopeptide repeat protein [Actinokineospora baliensis]MBM7775484.1 tetratricopeptide (TPR) repeat protein [Actinokineospora baliensis]
MEPGSGPTLNNSSGSVHGSLVQAGTVGQVVLNSATELPTPFQLPPPPRSFVGRDQEESLLRSQIEPDWHGAPQVAVISGAGGIGKTAMALHHLHGARDQFPDGILYAELGAFSPTGPLRSEQVLEWFLLALGVPTVRMPSDLPSLQGLYRSITANRAIAVLLDDAHSAAQIRPLIPSSGASSVVVTSRRRLVELTLDGALFIDLQQLSEHGSITLLGGVVGAGRLASEPEPTQELVALCGGMPIALSLISARLLAYPHRSIAREVEGLRDDPEWSQSTLGEVSLEAVLSTSYEDLPPPLARVYRACSLHPGAIFGVEAAAAALGAPVCDTTTLLVALLDRNLVSQVGDHRFRYHDLLLTHARQRATLEDSDHTMNAAIRRMIEWYLDNSIEADLALLPHRRRLGKRFRRPTQSRFTSPREAMNWLTEEHHNITLAAQSAFEHKWYDLAWQFCEAQWGYYLHARRYSDWLTLHAIGIESAQKIGDFVAEARLRLQLASALTNLRRYEEAAEECRAALRLTEHSGHEFITASAFTELAGIAQGKGQLLSALEHLENAKEIRDAIGSERSIALCQRRIGEVLTELGRYEEAIVALTESASALQRVDRGQQARALTCLGRAYVAVGQHSAGVEPLREALLIAKELDSTHYQAEAYAILGDISWNQDDAASAHEYWSAAHRVYSISGDPKALMVTAKLQSVTRASEPD